MVGSVSSVCVADSIALTLCICVDVGMGMVEWVGSVDVAGIMAVSVWGDMYVVKGVV